MDLIRRVLRDPLLHFLLLGGMLFGIHARYIVSPKVPGDDRTIVVDDDVLLEFMQLRARVFAEESFRERLAALSPIERKNLVDDYIREEVLYREALAMGMDRDDYIIRRRLVQKVEFVTETLSRRAIQLSGAEVRHYFEAHRADYRVEPTITFTHVFFDAERRGAEAALAEATRAVDQLNAAHVPFEDAVKHSDRFPFHLNYVERTPDFVASHFGPDITGSLMRLEVDPERWQGPFTSSYGAHIVMLTERREGRDAKLEEIEGRVRLDAENEAKNRVIREAIDGLVEKYDIRIAGEESGRSTGTDEGAGS